MKKVSMILALALVLCMVGGAVAEDISANPGKNVVVPINVESKDAAFSILKYTYDAKRFEYKDTTINGTIQKGYKDGQIAIADISNKLNGNIGSLLFKVKDNAEKGSSLVDFTASGTFNRDEKETTLTVTDQNLIVEGLVSSFVRRCYSLILGRSADEGGLNYWCDKLRNKEQTPIQVAWGFVFSPEMDAQRKIVENPDALLDALYRL